MWGEVDKIIRCYKISSGVHAGTGMSTVWKFFDPSSYAHEPFFPPYLTNPHDHQRYQRETNPQPLKISS